jgi:hypothetical protein
MRKKIWFFVLALFLLLVAFTIYKEWNSTKSLKSNWAITKGVITQASKEMMNGSTNLEVTFTIQIDGKDITRTTRITCAGSAGFFLFNKTMDVVYEKGNQENCQMLLSREDYQQCKLLPPKDVLHVLEVLEAACGKME